MVRRIVWLLILTTATAVIAGCAQTATEEATPEVTPEVTPEATPEVSDAGNDDIVVGIDPALQEGVPPGTTEDGAYFMSVTSFTQDEEDPTLYLLDASVSNQTDTEVTVTESALVVVAEDGTRYEPVEMPDNIQPALVGAVLGTEETLRGFAQYEIPEDLELSHAEWCVDEACEIVVGSTLN